ncbi:MAG: hypothetical protein ACRC8S_03425 [Fimbriiglobus sp.]
MNPNSLNDLTQDDNQRRMQDIDLTPIADVASVWPTETASAFVDGAGSVAGGAIDAVGAVAEGALEVVGAILSGIFSG